MERYADILNLPRPESAHPKMALGNRANQFVPMDALRGFSVAVLTKQREKQLITKNDLSKDAVDLLDWQIQQTKPEDTVTITYFHPERDIGNFEVGTYITETDQVEEIDMVSRVLVLSHASVPFANIYAIESKTFDQVYEDVSYGESN